MKRSHTTIVCALLSLTFVAGSSTQVSAERAKKRPLLTFSVAGGLSNPVDDLFGSIYGVGMHGCVTAGIQLSNAPFRIRGRGVFVRLNEPDFIIGPSRSDGHLDVTGGLGEIVFVARAGRSVLLTVFGGLGRAHMRLRHTGVDYEFVESAYEATDDLLDVGAGLEWRSRRWGLQAEWWYLGFASTDRLELLQYAIGLVYAIPL